MKIHLTYVSDADIWDMYINDCWMGSRRTLTQCEDYIKGYKMNELEQVNINTQMARVNEALDRADANPDAKEKRPETKEPEYITYQDTDVVGSEEVMDVFNYLKAE